MFSTLCVFDNKNKDMPPDLEPKHGSTGSWDPSKLFNVSEQEMNLMRRRKEMRTMLRDEFTKRYTNPYTRGQGGHIVRI